MQIISILILREVFINIVVFAKSSKQRTNTCLFTINQIIQNIESSMGTPGGDLKRSTFGGKCISICFRFLNFRSLFVVVWVTSFLWRCVEGVCGSGYTVISVQANQICASKDCIEQTHSRPHIHIPTNPFTHMHTRAPYHTHALIYTHSQRRRIGAGRGNCRRGLRRFEICCACVRRTCNRDWRTRP